MKGKDSLEKRKEFKKETYFYEHNVAEYSRLKYHGDSHGKSKTSLKIFLLLAYSAVCVSFSFGCLYKWWQPFSQEYSLLFIREKVFVYGSGLMTAFFGASGRPCWILPIRVKFFFLFFCRWWYVWADGGQCKIGLSSVSGEPLVSKEATCPEPSGDLQSRPSSAPYTVSSSMLLLQTQVRTLVKVELVEHK